MDQPEVDIWFGPGGLRGVFGAGVACGLQAAIERGECDPSRLRLFGSSVGCLNAVFLATGNAGCGLDIYREDVAPLIRPSNLLPSAAARLGNWMSRPLGRRIFPVPSVLNVDHVFQVMQRRAPDITEQLGQSPMPVFAESLDRDTGEFRHVHLQGVQDPLSVIRGALNCFPFTWLDNSPSLDSGIRGYGFDRLLDAAGPRKAVVVLNEPATPRFRNHLYGVLAATLAANPRVSQLYLRRQTRCCRAIHVARHSDQALLLVPSRPIVAKPNGFLEMHEEGRIAAREIIRFSSARLCLKTRIHTV
jgi:hypothetical protein